MPQSHEEQSAFIRDRIQRYFSRLAEISAASPPGFINAANGYWRDNTEKDEPLKALEAAPTEALTDDAQKIFTIFSTFQAGIRKSFADNPNHHADLETNPDLIWPPIETFAGSIIDIVGSIYDLFGKDKAARDEAKKTLRADIEELIRKIKGYDYTLRGENANGHIAGGVKAAADKLLADIEATFQQKPAGTNGSILGALEAVGTGFAAQSTDDHDPWLRPDWQIAFEKISQAAASGLAT